MFCMRQIEGYKVSCAVANWWAARAQMPYISGIRAAWLVWRGRYVPDIQAGVVVAVAGSPAEMSCILGILQEGGSESPRDIYHVTPSPSPSPSSQAVVGGAGRALVPHPDMIPNCASRNPRMPFPPGRRVPVA